MISGLTVGSLVSVSRLLDENLGAEAGHSDLDSLYLSVANLALETECLESLDLVAENSDLDTESSDLETENLDLDPVHLDLYAVKSDLET